MELKHIATRVGRLSSFLKEELKMSTGLMNRLKWQDKLFVNGIAVHTDYPVRTGDTITAALDEPTPEYPAEPGELTVIYEDAHILAVDKPAGMLIHPSRAAFTGTLANRVLHYYQTTGQQSAFHPITRLDRDTYGIVLLAKNAYIHALLNDLQDQGALRKTYQAPVYGGPCDDTGIIDAPIARRPLPSLLRFVDDSGKPSRTAYRVVRRQGETTLLELRPLTGRTHQLRVHCAHMGYPILGDPQYGTPESIAYSQSRGLTTQQLFACSLSFPHPVTGQPMVLESQFSSKP